MDPVNIIVSVVLSTLVVLALVWVVFKAVKNARHATPESGYHGGPTAPGVVSLGQAGTTVNQDSQGPKRGRRDGQSR